MVESSLTHRRASLFVVLLELAIVVSSIANSLRSVICLADQIHHYRRDKAGVSVSPPVLRARVGKCGRSPSLGAGLVRLGYAPLEHNTSTN